ncbi:MAG: hypothetical protein MZU97_15360 [Bacillus subtilis]|nr:hypothetical protein [Bacillus subtilis]
MFFGTSGTEYQTALETLLASLSNGTFLGDDWPRYVYQTYAGANPFVAFDLPLLLIRILHSLGISVVASAYFAVIVLTMGAASLLYHLLAKAQLSLAWKIIGPLVYVVLMVLTAMFLSMYFFGLLVYYAVFLWVVGRFFRRQPWLVSLFVIALAISSPTTVLVSLLFFTGVFMLESAKHPHPSATDWVVSLFKFLLYVIIGAAVSVVIYYAAAHPCAAFDVRICGLDCGIRVFGIDDPHLSVRAVWRFVPQVVS